MQNHGIEEQRRILPLLRRLAGELGVKLAATNDCHYITKADHRMQHVLTCIQTNTTVDNPSMEFATDEFYVKSRDEMAAALPGFEEALDNTVEIARRCNLEFTFGELKLPYFTAPDGQLQHSTPGGITANISDRGAMRVCASTTVRILLPRWSSGWNTSFRSSKRWDISITT